jgi:dienelactone hydrolase
MKIIIRIIKWTGLLLILLIVSLVVYIQYTIWAFDTQTLPVNHGKVNAELFLGSGENQTLIVGLGGAEGGNAWASDYWSEQRNVFIDRGYAFLAIAYFGMEGIPKQLDRIALDGVHNAVMNAAKNAKVNNKCIAIIGSSKGAELALALSSYYADYNAVVAMVPGNAIFASLTDAMVTPSFSINDVSLPFVPVPWSASPALLSGDLRGAFTKMLEDKEAVNKARIKTEKINGSILFLSATNDEMWPSTEMSEAMMQDLDANKFPHVYKHIAIEGNHSAPLEHFGKVEEFLEDNINCSDEITQI